MTLNGLGIYSILFRREDPDELLHSCGQYVNPLLEYDQKRGTKLLASLQTYLDENGALRKSARRLFVHPNTLGGRLERIEQPCGLDLQDAKSRLNLQIAFEVYQLANSVLET